LYIITKLINNIYILSFYPDLPVTEPNNIPFDPIPQKEVNECIASPTASAGSLLELCSNRHTPVQYKQTLEYKRLMDELIMKTHCHICETETKINNIFCSKNHYRIFANYGYQSCVYFEKYRYCSHCC
jgi:hypothetical protein